VSVGVATHVSYDGPRYVSNDTMTV